jgi:hypothetical protein
MKLRRRQPVTSVSFLTHLLIVDEPTDINPQRQARIRAPEPCTQRPSTGCRPGRPDRVSAGGRASPPGRCPPRRCPPRAALQP